MIFSPTNYSILNVIDSVRKQISLTELQKSIFKIPLKTVKIGIYSFVLFFLKKNISLTRKKASKVFKVLKKVNLFKWKEQ